MSTLRTSRAGRLSALVVTGVLGLAMIMMFGSFASTAQAGSSAASAAAAPVPVATGPLGSMTSEVTGTTAQEDAVTGTFTPLKFIRKDGRVWARGILAGEITDGDAVRTFTVLRTLRVNRINGEAVRTSRVARAAAECEILDLVIRPIDLNLLGLEIHLDRVHLNITAVSGPGNLLGNLLCAVAGLLDGGLGGLLGELTRLLNRILGQLGLGL